MKNILKPISFDDYMKENLRDSQYRNAFEKLDHDPDVVLIEALSVAKKKGLTQKELAKRMKTTQSVISRTFSEHGNPTLKFLQRYAKALNMNLEIQLKPQ